MQTHMPCDKASMISCLKHTWNLHTGQQAARKQQPSVNLVKIALSLVWLSQRVQLQTVTGMELGLRNQSMVWLLGSNSILAP